MWESRSAAGSTCAFQCRAITSQTPKKSKRTSSRWRMLSKSTTSFSYWRTREKVVGFPPCCLLIAERLNNLVKWRQPRKKYNRIYTQLAINAALGFDTYLVMRHGQREPWNPGQVQAEKSKGIMRGALAGRQLGCYFCNDVVAPGDVSFTIISISSRFHGGISLLHSLQRIEPWTSSAQWPGPEYLSSPPVWPSNWWSLFSNIRKSLSFLLHDNTISS